MKISCMSYNLVISRRWQLHAGLVLAQMSSAGYEILSKVAFQDGAGIIAFSFYRNSIASLILGLLAYYIEKKKRPALTLSKFCIFFCLGFIGVTLNQVSYLVGLRHTSAIYSSALRNVTPVVTFIIAIVCKMERVHIKRLDGVLKVIGPALTMCGSIMLSLFKVFAVSKSKGSSHVQQSAESQSETLSKNVNSTLNLLGLIHMHMGSWYLGTLCIMVACVAFASFLILQTPVMEKYPAPISFIALACFSSVTQLPILGAIYERRASSWKLLKIREISSVLYAGIIASALVSAILSWGVYEAGPVLVAAYQPLETVITALFGYIFLKETLPLASILGGVVVVIGLYLLIWGQERELKYRVQPALRHSEGSVPQTVSQSNGSSSIEVVCPLKVAEDLRSSSTPRCHLAAKQTSIEDENETGLELAVTH